MLFRSEQADEAADVDLLAGRIEDVARALGGDGDVERLARAVRVDDADGQARVQGDGVAGVDGLLDPTLGDQGLLGSVELAYTAPPLKGFVLQPYLFLDGGATSLKQAAPGFPLNQSVSGYGVGLRANALATNWLSFDLGWGIPASNTVEPGRVGPGESIVFFKANLSF